MRAQEFECRCALSSSGEPYAGSYVCTGTPRFCLLITPCKNPVNGGLDLSRSKASLLFVPCSGLIAYLSTWLIDRSQPEHNILLEDSTVRKLSFKCNVLHRVLYPRRTIMDSKKHASAVIDASTRPYRTRTGLCARTYRVTFFQNLSSHII